MNVQDVFDALAADGYWGQEEDQGVGNYYLTDVVERRNFERFVGLIPGPRVLVVGCGDGLEAELLCERGFEVTAFDLSPNMVAATRRRLDERGLNATLQIGDVTALDRERFDTYDAVMYAQTAAFIASDVLFDKSLADLVALLNPGGVLLYSTTFYDEPHVRVWYRAGEPVGGTMYWPHPIASVVPVMQRLGMTICHTEPFDSRTVSRFEHYQND